MAKKPAKKTSTKIADGYGDNFDEVIGSINSEYGGGTLITGRDVGAVVNVDVFPSGVAAIDVALGCGGIPQGRIIEIYGPESSGKTTTCLQFIAACQSYYFPNKERYGRVVFIDAEHALDPEWAAKIGVNLDKMAIAQPGNGEEALKIATKLVKSKSVDLIVIDSVAALVPKSEIDGEIGDHHVGAQARMMSQACRILSSVCSKTKTTIIFINQIREKVGIMFGSPEVTPGGRALKFYASIRGEIRKGSAIKMGDVVVGFRPTLKIIKNKVAPPFTTAEFDICVGTKQRPVFGIDKLGSLIDVGTMPNVGVIETAGSWYAYNGQRLGNGLVNATACLSENSDLAETIRDEIYSKLFHPPQFEPTQELIEDEIIDGD